MANTGQNQPPPLKSPTKHGIARAPIAVAPLKLAEHRYGREEMLALLNPGISPPNALQHFSELLRRESITPLSFAPLNDEEQVWVSRKEGAWSCGGDPRERKRLE